MALSRRTFNNILIYICLAMLFAFQLPQMLAERRAREAAVADELLSVQLFSAPLARIEGPDWLLELRDGQWAAEPKAIDAHALAAQWQQLKLLPLQSDAGEAARALASASTVVLVWPQAAVQPVTVRVVILGDQLLVDAGGRLGQLPRGALRALSPVIKGS